MKNDITFRELKNSGYVEKTINEEIQANLISKIKAKEPVFEGLWGYEDTVIPQLKKAILAGHHINLLGLRGQAKTRIARSMVSLLDDYMPIVKGSEINDSPFNPISKFAKDLLNELGDEMPITWVHRSDRFFEKLATPDVNVADLIGDIDPIKAATLKLPYSDERVLHYGMIPRANRCIFVLNELPDLQARIQVSLFNILQEGDIQIRGFQLRMPLDIQFIFTANPEDYTNRGSIVTPLKDRIGSQIFTHYPKTIALAREITEQEAKIKPEDQARITIPDLAKDLLEEVAFAARDSEYVDAKSGVSARLTISAMENLVAAAKLRLLETGDETTTIRLLDFLSIIPSITGKIELVYEGEQEGAEYVAKILIDQAVMLQFERLFPRIPKLEKEGLKTAYTDLIKWFQNNQLQLNYTDSDKEFYEKLNGVKPLSALVEDNTSTLSDEDKNFCKELVLWALTINKKLDKFENQQSFIFDS
ncbi:sigma 54-interacting transcriptional regulator [Epilithonimonas arachidiradicis]|uniref:Magnesium chelatase n=1 Tax=Epilithonimonas arachidiradicis TaxID=1617282 RepID=A0A420D8H9_9FLAO|nr:sigma 54-interacting transcriptional regulator [Epilithonimonas arachidiradicis]RKE87184.1 magnesium chelatase subunit I [Epilithonimonas arachidiradicis]GGG58980.1 magnesium chelatase [Epilithonimonas arachidiradicis]